MNKYSISIAIPAYNEEKNVGKVIENCFKFLPEISKDFEVLVVNDGSRDKTGEILENLRKNYPKLKVFHQKQNKGVGEAWRVLYRMVSKNLIFTLPADGQNKVEEILKFLPYLDQFDIIVGRRVDRQDPFIRTILAWIYNLTIRILFSLKIKDIDSIKLYKLEIFKKIKIETTSAFEETEILVKAKRKNYKIGEIPIEHFPRRFGSPSGVKFKTVTKVFKDLVWFYFSRK